MAMQPEALPCTGCSIHTQRLFSIVLVVLFVKLVYNLAAVLGLALLQVAGHAGIELEALDGAWAVTVLKDKRIKPCLWWQHLSQASK